MKDVSDLGETTTGGTSKLLLDLGHIAPVGDVGAPVPTSWCWTDLRTVAELKGGITKGQQRKAGATVRPVPYLRVANVQRGYLDLSEIKTIDATEVEIADLRLLPGDVLFNEGGDRDKLGRGWVWNGQLPECIHQNHVFRARLYSPDIDPRFVSWYGNTAGQAYFLEHGKQTTNLASINLTLLGNLPIPLPPAEEQRRIVARIDALLTRLDASVAALRRAQANLKRYRAAVLAAAVEGRLTAEWRAAHPPSEDGPALLARILAERRRVWEEAERARYAQAGKTPPLDWDLRYREPSAPDTAGLPALPEGWCWVSLDHISCLITDGDHNPPKRVTAGVPHLTAKNVVGWTLSEQGCTYITESAFAQVRKRYSPMGGDVIITCVGTVGRTAIVPNGYVFSADRNLAVVRLLREVMKPIFLQYNLNAPGAQTLIATASGSTAQPHFYLSDIRSFSVALAPLEEQGEIVAEVERRLSAVAHVEERVEASLARAERLRQSILKRAFAGKLAPRDRADEPASALLARILAAREADPQKAQSTRKTRKARGAGATRRRAAERQLALRALE